MQWTCEKDSKARASHQDAVPDTACRFTNIEDFIDPKGLEEMKKVKIKGGKKFQRWLQLAKKHKMRDSAWCSHHMKMCLVSIGSNLSLNKELYIYVSEYGFWRYSSKQIAEFCLQQR